jgi:uncharacterized membrane protein (DUF4010 family)
MDWSTLRGLVAAIAAGLLIGIERGWHLRNRRSGSRVAGIRTFTLLGAAGGLIALIVVTLGPLVGAILLAGFVAIIVVGYARAGASHRDATTQIAALVALALGVIAGSGMAGLAIAGAALTTLILAVRERSHRLIQRLSQQDIDVLTYFTVIAGGVLPFLPNRRFGPYAAWNPFQLWLVVVLVIGFSFAGYIANRLIGERRGTLATAVIGGAYSSTAVTVSLAQRLRAGEQGPYTAGIAIASAVMYCRVLVLVAALAAPIFGSMLKAIGPALVCAWLIGGLAWRRSQTSGEDGGRQVARNPIALAPALGFLVAVAAAALLVRWAQASFGESGVAWSLFIAGSFDVDAAIVTLSGLPENAIAAPMAALAIGGTVAINMAFKIAIAGVTARRKALPAMAALGASLAVLLATLAMLAAA